MTLPEAFAIAVQHHQSRRLAEAEAIYRQILAVDPRHSDAMHLLGLLAHQVGRNDVAVEIIRQAIALDPTGSEIHSNLGVALAELGRLDEANAAYRRAIELKPDSADAWSNLGNVLWNKGQFVESVAACRRAIEIKPEHAEAHNNLGSALGFLRQFEEAIAEFRRVIELDPNYALAHNNLGIALQHQGHTNDAVAACRRATQLKPEYAAAHNNLAVALLDQGHCDGAIAAFRQALQLKPDIAVAHSNLLLALHYPAKVDTETIFQEHCRWDEVHAQPLAKFITPHTNEPDPDRRLRIGYVSPDRPDHSVSFFMEHLLANHDPAQFEVFYYAESVAADPSSVRLREQVRSWCKTTGLTDEQVASLIRRDGIDILVDLAGHTGCSRLLVFARKPAPVQVTYLGYCDTTGMSAMDYRFTDALADPPGTTEHLHSEQLVRLPDSMWCFRPSDAAPPVGALPALDLGHITFGCFNILPKITEEFLALWSQILLQVPGSRLLLKNSSLRSPAVQQRMRTSLEKNGVGPERVELVEHVPAFAGHLGLYGRVDIALDPFPYHGTTTTCEALWQGVPVVTLAGRTHAARVGVSLLTNVGLPELIAANTDDYIRIAASLATDLPRLSEWRATLREKMKASPLMDAPRFARNVEHAYREMWRAWCAKPCSNPPS